MNFKSLKFLSLVAFTSFTVISLTACGKGHQKSNHTIYTNHLKTPVGGNVQESYLSSPQYVEKFAIVDAEKSRKKLVTLGEKIAEEHKKNEKSPLYTWASTATRESIDRDTQLKMAHFLKAGKVYFYGYGQQKYGPSQSNYLATVKGFYKNNWVEVVCSWDNPIDVTSGKCAEEVQKGLNLKLEKSDLPKITLR